MASECETGLGGAKFSILCGPFRRQKFHIYKFNIYNNINNHN